MNAKIRNIFDVEFNKKFQGSLSMPFLRSSANNQSAANRYLFFITDNCIDDKEIEDTE